MTDTPNFTAGEFCWLELYTHDADKAKQYYGDLFKWTSETMPNPAGDCNYQMFANQGQPFAGLMPLNDELKAKGAQPCWLAYVLVDNADDTAAKTQQLGGKVICPAFDIPQAGRMAILADPEGAVFSIWQNFKDECPAYPAKTVGFPAWYELSSHKVEPAKTFYTQLFGWTANTETMPSGKVYTTFNQGDKQVAGLTQFPAEAGPAPANWGVYFGVENCDTAAAAATKAGGEMLYEPVTAPTVGRFTGIKDPQGIFFSVFEAEK